MARNLTYRDTTGGWTLADFKTLLDVLATWHDPNNNRYGRAIGWNVADDSVTIELEITDVARTDIDSMITDISDTLSTAPNSWDTSDTAFSWGG